MTFIKTHEGDPHAHEGLGWNLDDLPRWMWLGSRNVVIIMINGSSFGIEPVTALFNSDRMCIWLVAWNHGFLSLSIGDNHPN